jgi:hypothetical protein
MSFFPISCKAFRSIPSYLHQLEVQWWISSFILQTSCLEDVNLQITRFRLCKIKWLKVFNPWSPASWARSRSSTNPAFYTDFSPLLDFSGSVGFDTWRIYVPLFWATCRLFSIFLLFWILERFWSLGIITLFTPVLLRHLGGVIFVWFFLLLCSTLCPFVTKKGGVIWTGIVFLTGQVIFVPEWPKGEFVSLWLATFWLENITYV